ncbi:GGDEF domain-containing protein [Thermocrinis sp.]|uniref:GGDEF domain-containing protein n=1 Tax=Thermocrinis sp. TaxID=2024383 RepID=UPI002FDCFEE7
MLKRRILIRVILSFLITFFPTAFLIHFVFQRIGEEALIKERDILYNNFKTLLKHKESDLELAKSKIIQSKDDYYIWLRVDEECGGIAHYRITDRGLYYGKKIFLGEQCYFLGINFKELLEFIKELSHAEWLFYYDRTYIDRFPQEFLDIFVKDKLFKNDVVIAGFSDESVLNVPFKVSGYLVYGSGFKKSLLVEFPLFEENGYQFGQVLLVKDISPIYANFYTLMGVLVAYSFVLSLLSSFLLYKFSGDLIARIIKLQEFSNRIKMGDFSKIEPFETSKKMDELDHLRNSFIDAAITIGNLLSELEAKNKQLQELAYYDSLTGLPNRRFFFEHANLIFEEAKRYGKKLSLLIIDIDHFKKINDAYGHDAGDIVLKVFADVLKGVVRQSDICARMGGEEFAVLLPNTGLDEARVLAERIRSAVASRPVEYDHKVILVTTSIGVSEFRSGMESIDDLIKEADIALYRAKEGGRNRVEVFTPDKTGESQT